MSIGSTRKISSTTPTSSKVDGRSYAPNNRSQFVENIDTNNNVLVRDDNNDQSHTNDQHPQKERQQTNFNTGTANISGGLEAFAVNNVINEEETSPTDNRKIDIYSNNQSIIKDEEIERTGRSYLKHFYEKNEHFIDIDELV